MKLLKILFGDKPRRPKLTKIGFEKAVCPNCLLSLPKFPGRKTKCKDCSKFIYVRTRPLDNKRILVKKDDLPNIEEQWAIKNDTWEQLQEARQEIQNIRDHLRKINGFEPSDNDVMWNLYNKRSVEYASKYQWGLYRNNQFQMAELLTKEKKLASALNHLSVVIFFDLNGAMNGCTYNDKPMSNSPAENWNLEYAFLAPGIMQRFERIITEQNLSTDRVKKAFAKATESYVTGNYKMPLTIDKAWSNLVKECHLLN